MIEVKHVSKTLKDHQVLKDVSVTFEAGHIYGIYGENGSGKTIFLRALAGLLIPDQGTIAYDGKILHQDIDFPPDLGIIIEHMELLGSLNAYENLEVIAQYRQVATKEDITEALKRVGLNSSLKVKKFSLGMKQRLNLAQAIFEHQRYLLLDEPFNALDEKGRAQLEQILLEEKAKEATIIMTHHYMDELKRCSDMIYQVHKGQLIYQKGDIKNESPIKV